VIKGLTSFPQRDWLDSQLSGALVVDPAGADPSRDQIWVITEWFHGYPDRPFESALVFNGKAWPHNERLTLAQGDSVHWRFINLAAIEHPLHLHGFYYRVDQLTGPTPPGGGPPPRDLMVVTQRMPAFTAMSMTWVPERPGNWLFHCHFQVHVARGVVIDLADPEVPNAPVDMHENHAFTGMQGLVMGIIVAPRPGAKAEPEPASGPPARQLRLVAVQDSGFPSKAPSMRFTLDDGTGSTRLADAGPGFSPPMILERGKPVAITVVNHLREPTAVHWHGMELDPYNDGVSGFSGMGSRVSPIIAPSDSFVAHFTPPRAGTFIYHSHVNEPIQHRAGMLGALIVVDSLGTRGDEATIFLKSARAGVAAQPTPVLDVNGQVNPDTITLHVGRPARFRLISLALLNPNAVVILTSRPDSATVLRADSLVLRWQPLAKDGADLPAAMRAPRLARQLVSMGETYDFEFTPVSRGNLRIEVRGAGAGALLGRVPIRVE
jgi:FtsP/CotA-like multicopper oxidase with cupredoxin domain